MNLNNIPALDDNYIWVLNDGASRCLIAGPGDARPVLNAIAASGWQPEAIFLTHHHHNHVDGVRELVKKFPRAVVYDPQGAQDKGTTQIVKDNEIAFVLGHEFSVTATLSHTLGHVYYFSKPYLFCGDTLFSGGCGRLFGGTPSQMYQSLKKLSVLPDDTLICCVHEYALSNMRFALSILPYDLSINGYHRKVKELRAENQTTPSVILKNKQQVNVLLRTKDINLINVINKETLLQQPEKCFAWLGSKKDRF